MQYEPDSNAQNALTAAFCPPPPSIPPPPLHPIQNNFVLNIHIVHKHNKNSKLETIVRENVCNKAKKTVKSHVFFDFEKTLKTYKT